jgi:hypothetical protein
MTDPVIAGVRKLSYFMPLGKAQCEACGNTVLYNLAVGVTQHEDESVACDRPFPKVERTPEEEARIAAAEALAVAEDRAHRDRHSHLLRVASHPVLTALIEAHGPVGDGVYPSCATCRGWEDETTGEQTTPEDWPCPVWLFISDRMGDA